MEQTNTIQKVNNNSKQKDSKETPQTLLQHIECVIELVEQSKLNKEFFQKAKKSIAFIEKKMNITTIQAVLFAVFVEKSDDSRIQTNELSAFIGCRNIKTISLMSDIDELERLRLIRCCRSESRHSYRVPAAVVNAIKQNTVYQPESTENLTTKEVFKHISRLFNERGNNEISCEALVGELQSLFEDNASLLFCRQIKAYEKVCGDEDLFLLLLLFCHRYVNWDDDCITIRDYEDLYEEKWTAKEIKSDLQKGHCELIKNNILAYINDNGFEDRNYLKLSETAKEKLFAELDIKVQQADNKKGLTLHESITPKQLFYNKREQAQIVQLTSLLQQDNFRSVQEKLEKGGMRKGFACLFYGAPGTGKTETVYQLAHATGRDIMMVDIAATKSMWYGENEKNIKKIFDSYHAYLKTSETAPILLFNEADAIIGKRKEAGKSSIDQTENAIQNILLQEMETLDGIMIATTNLAQNLDKAFERRFLYKIEFDKPGIEAKEKIWHVMMPALSEQERLELANAYHFSGGQIENIVRKYTVDCILNGTTPTIETVHSYCQSEFLYKSNEQKRIGYVL
jgi:SpoVK/Ycf46/Vps4 family AAA+-type ATPase